MENQGYYFRVGLFVLMMVVLTVATLVFFRKNGDQTVHLRYAIFFDGAVTGLSIGAPVRLKGIEVGTVSDIGFSSYEDDRIRVIADIVDTAPIRKDTVATLSVQGITGIAYISLKNTGENGEFLTKEEGEPYFVIQSQSSTLEQVVSSVPELIDRYTKLAEKVTVLFTEENMNALGGTLQNAEKLTYGLSHNSEQLEQLLFGASQAIDNVAEASKTLNDLMSTVDGSVINAAENISQASLTMREVADNVDGMINENRESIHTFTNEGLADLSQLIKESRSVVRQMNYLTQELKEDPSKIIRKPQYEGYKIP